MDRAYPGRAGIQSAAHRQLQPRSAGRCLKSGARSTCLRVAPDRWQAEAHAGDPASPVHRPTLVQSRAAVARSAHNATGRRFESCLCNHPIPRCMARPAAPCATTVDSAPPGHTIGGAYIISAPQPDITTPPMSAGRGDAMHGWICPKCQRSNAPHVSACPCSVPAFGQPGPSMPSPAPVWQVWGLPPPVTSVASGDPPGSCSSGRAGVDREGQ